MISSSFHIPKGFQIRYCSNERQCVDAANEILSYINSNQGFVSVWGFDAEWPVSYKKESNPNSVPKVSLIQFANDRIAYLFHIQFYGIPNELRDVLSSHNILKVGVNISGDIIRLIKAYPFLNIGGINGVIEIRHVINATIPFPKVLTTSLAYLTEFYLKKVLEKPEDVRCGMWNKDLSADQKKYAALDALASYQVHDRVLNEYLEIIKYIDSDLFLNIMNSSNTGNLEIEKGDDKSSNITEKINLRNSSTSFRWIVDTLKWHSKSYPTIDGGEDNILLNNTINIGGSIEGSSVPFSKGGYGGYHHICLNFDGFYGDIRPITRIQWETIICEIRKYVNTIESTSISANDLNKKNNDHDLVSV